MTKRASPSFCRATPYRLTSRASSRDSSGKVPLTSVYKGTSVLMIAILATTALLLVFPQIALWLPATMK